MLRRLADETSEFMAESLDKAIEAYRRQRFMEELNESFAALRADPEA